LATPGFLRVANVLRRQFGLLVGALLRRQHVVRSNPDAGWQQVSRTCRASRPPFCAINDDHGLTFTYNGVNWSAGGQVGSSHDEFSRPISCAAPNHCLLTVGELGDVATYDGGAWSAPEEILHARGWLRSIDCATQTYCVAIDNWENVLSYNGAGWSGLTPLPPSDADHVAYGSTQVSCASPTLCLAVSNRSGGVYTYNGSDWSRQNLNGSQAMASLRSTSCASTSFCMLAVVTL